MEIRPVNAQGAPIPIGPYSQALTAGGFVFCSGQVPLDPVSGVLVEGDADAQTRRILDNLEAVLTEAGSSLARTVKLNVYLKDMADFPAVNRVFQERLAMPFPARSTVQVAALPKGAAVEIDAVAVVSLQEPAV